MLYYYCITYKYCVFVTIPIQDVLYDTVTCSSYDDFQRLLVSERKSFVVVAHLLILLAVWSTVQYIFYFYRNMSITAHSYVSWWLTLEITVKYSLVWVIHSPSLVWTLPGLYVICVTTRCNSRHGQTWPLWTEVFLNVVWLDLLKDFHEHDSKWTFSATGFESVMGYNPVVCHFYHQQGCH